MYWQGNVFFIFIYLGNLVKLSQFKYTVSENEGIINISVICIGVPETSFKVKVLVENVTSSSIANGKTNHLTQFLSKCYIDVLFLSVYICVNCQLLMHHVPLLIPQ